MQRLQQLTFFFHLSLRPAQNRRKCVSGIGPRRIILLPVRSEPSSGYCKNQAFIVFIGLLKTSGVIWLVQPGRWCMVLGVSGGTSCKQTPRVLCLTV